MSVSPGDRVIYNGSRSGGRDAPAVVEDVQSLEGLGTVVLRLGGGVKVTTVGRCVRPRRDLATVLWRRGRLSLVFEPRDLWVGVYVGPGAVYVCVVPGVAVRWAR